MEGCAARARRLVRIAPRAFMASQCLSPVARPPPYREELLGVACVAECGDGDGIVEQERRRCIYSERLPVSEREGTAGTACALWPAGLDVWRGALKQANTRVRFPHTPCSVGQLGVSSLRSQLRQMPPLTVTFPSFLDRSFLFVVTSVAVVTLSLFHHIFFSRYFSLI